MKFVINNLLQIFFNEKESIKKCEKNIIYNVNSIHFLVNKSS